MHSPAPLEGAARLCGGCRAVGARGSLSGGCAEGVPGRVSGRMYMFRASGEVRNGCPCPLSTCSDDPVRGSARWRPQHFQLDFKPSVVRFRQV